MTTENPAEIVPRLVPSPEKTDSLIQAQFDDAQASGLPTSKMLSVMTQFAQQCVKTGQMPKTIDTVEKAIMVFQAGREIGVPPMQALNSYYFVNNKLTMYGPTVIQRIRLWAKIEHGICSDIEANVTITRKDDGTSLSARVTMADLAARGITGGKDTFKKHGRTMLIYKAVGEIVRHIVPEATGSAAVEGDWGDNAEEEKNMAPIRDTSTRLKDAMADKKALTMGGLTIQPTHENETENNEGSQAQDEHKEPANGNKA